MQQNNGTVPGKDLVLRSNGPRKQKNLGQLLLNPLRSFVLLENCSPVVNSFNLGSTSPFLLGPSTLQLAQIKTYLALQQLTSGYSPSSYTLLNQALLKVTMSRPMFNPRGSFSSPRYPNQGGSNMPRGPFMGGMRMEGSRPRMGSEGHAFRGLPQGFTVSEAFTRLHALGLQTPGQDRSKMMDVQLPQHREDPRLTKEQLDIPDLPLGMGVQESPPINRSEHGQWPYAGTRTEHMPTDFGSSRLDEPSPRSQNRYNSESASSILASFGLSNEDLEELSHYPDDQLTPENMPLILREIRMRKLSRPEEPSSGFSFGKDTENIVKGNVIDYGHASKYGYSEDPLERMLDSDLPNQDIERPKYDCLPETSVSSMRGSREFPSQMCNEPPLQSVTQPAFPGSKRDEKVKPVSEENVQPGLPIEALVTSVGDSRNKNKPPGKNGPVRNLKNLENQNSQSFGIQSSQNFGSQAPPNFGNQAPLPYGNHPPATFGNQPPAAFGSSAPPMFGNQAAGTALAQPTFPVAQGPWKPPPATPSDVKVTKKLPTPSMMNDYYATTPRIYPHMCSLCNVECRHLKDWIEHQNTASHIESCRRLRQQYPDWNPEVLSSARKDVDAKAKEGTKTRSASPRRRRSRSRSTSASRAPRSRSRSPHHLDSRRESHRRIRTRSRSPRNAGALRRSR
ncbi:zinc finger protein 638 [Protopterus annectens]|uniref:zinc finger protein 638 n=1 Tax=Protopterus annectens TaxID=7888 RepID=UPI001CFA7EB7|nr:zinc finger protein 638 [Protopterus annectens]